MLKRLKNLFGSGSNDKPDLSGTGSEVRNDLPKKIPGSIKARKK